MNNPLNNHQELLQFTLEKSTDLPAARRVKILRGLAAICGDQAEQKLLLTLADDLAQSDKRCCEFKFNFSQEKSVSII